MNWNVVKGNWTLVRKTTQLPWGRLAHDPIGVPGYRHDHRHNLLTGKIRIAYDAANQLAEEQLKEFVGPHRPTGPGL